MKILVTGASSYVGARIYVDLKAKYEVVGTYHNNKIFDELVKLDLTKDLQIKALLQDERPDIVIHVANYPSPSRIKGNEENFLKLNRDATKTLVQEINNIRAKLVFISSQSAINPDNLYGQLKLKSEDEVKKVKQGYLILRPSLIIGHSPNTESKRTFNTIMKYYRDNIESPFDTSWLLQPTYIAHLSQAIDKTIELNNWNKVISIYIDEAVTQEQIANDILSHIGKKADGVDLGIKIPLAKEDLSELKKFNLKPNTYSEVIEEIIIGI